MLGVATWVELCVWDAVAPGVGVPVDEGVALPDRVRDRVCEAIAVWLPVAVWLVVCAWLAVCVKLAVRVSLLLGV